MSISKQITVLITQIFFCAVCFAQREQIDSLKKILPSLHDSARVDCLNELSDIYLKFIPPKRPVTNRNIVDTAAKYAALAYEEAIKINYIHGRAESLSYKGEIENISDNFLAQEKLSLEAIALYKKTSNKKRLAETYWNLGQSLYAQSFFAEAIKNLDTAYAWYIKSGKVSGRYWGLSTAIYMESGNYEKAFELARKGLDIAIQNKDDYFKRWQLSKIRKPKI